LRRGYGLAAAPIAFRTIQNLPKDLLAGLSHVDPAAGRRHGIVGAGGCLRAGGKLMAGMRRREVLGVLGGAAAAWPSLARAQQRAMPVIGFFHLTSLETRRNYLTAFHRGLEETGYVEGRNVAVEYRWAQGQNERLPTLVADLVRDKVSVIVILESTHGALAAKAATQTIPVVFMQGADPVKIGLVSSLNRPGGNLTGINLFLSEVVAKRLELLVELASATKPIGYLRNPTNPVFAESETREVEAAARALGVQLFFVNASQPGDIETVFANLVNQVGALLVSGDGLLTNTLRDQIAALAARHAIPAIYAVRDCVLSGGLMSYGADLPNAWRQAGVYTGRLLKGERPADLPVQQVTKIELIINLKAANALGVAFPINLLARADEVIE
jgi:putative ABC transport system substrate-binding protein